MLEDLRIGVTVTGSGGTHLGKLSRIVIDRANSTVTHLVVDPGLAESGNALAPGGWEKPRERVVPVSLIATAGEHGVALSCDEATFWQQPLFEHKQFTDADMSAATGQQGPGQSRFELGEVLNYVSAGWGLGAAPYIAPADVSLNETPTSAAIAEGTPVWRIEPHDEVGHVDRVLADTQSQRVSALVIRRKGLLKHRVVLPIEQVANIDDGVVHITLADSALDALPRFKE